MRFVLVLLGTLPACGFHADASGPVDAPPAIDAPGDGSGGGGDGRTDAPPSIDAPPDAPPVWTLVDTLDVACAVQGTTSTVVLQAGVTYRLRASGECTVNTSNGSHADPEFYGYNVGPTYDVYSMIDNGIAIDDSTPGTTKNPRWGPYTTSHSYEAMWVGGGATITAYYHDTNYSNNQGSLTLQILALQ